MPKTLILINGPTAVGKTSLSLKLAEHLDTEIISTDSRQFYREMNIGTAKPNAAELSRVHHHFINNRSIADYYSAGDFEKEALQKIEELFSRGKDSVIAIGGSGLYMKALCEGLHEMPEANLELRTSLIESFEKNGLDWLQNELKTLDPIRYEQIDQQNPQRLMRAIELFHQGGFKPKDKVVRPFKLKKIGLELPREILYQKINQRVEDMMKSGLEQEVRDLLPFRDKNALQTVGYNELFDYFDGKTSLDRAVDLIKQHTRNYAKRQMTWFRADTEINWFPADNQESILQWVSES